MLATPGPLPEGDGWSFENAIGSFVRREQGFNSLAQWGVISAGGQEMRRALRSLEL